MKTFKNKNSPNKIVIKFQEFPPYFLDDKSLGSVQKYVDGLGWALAVGLAQNTISNPNPK